MRPKNIMEIIEKNGEAYDSGLLLKEEWVKLKEVERIERKIERWFQKWYQYSWNAQDKNSVKEIIEIKKLLSELRGKK